MISISVNLVMISNMLLNLRKEYIYLLEINSIIESNV